MLNGVVIREVWEKSYLSMNTYIWWMRHFIVSLWCKFKWGTNNRNVCERPMFGRPGVKRSIEQGTTRKSGKVATSLEASERGMKTRIDS